MVESAVDASAALATSKTLKTPENRELVINFVREQFPNATFEKIYDNLDDGNELSKFYDKCAKKGWTLIIIETAKSDRPTLTFGGFTTAEWEAIDGNKPDPHAFVFSVDDKTKYPVTVGD
jgi:hypothetical protein